MNILRVKFDNVAIFKNGITFDFTTEDKVFDKSNVTNIRRSIYTQKVIGIVGVNASGKSSVLKLIKFAMDILLGGKSLDQLDIIKGIINNDTIMTIDFYYENKFYQIVSKFKDSGSKIEEEGLPLIFHKEKIYSKNKSSVQSRNDLFDYEEEDVLYTREEVENQKFSVLKSKDSIILTITKDHQTYYSDMIRETNINLYRVKGEAQMEFINLFDSSIKSLNNSDESLEVTFKCNNIEINCTNPFMGDEFLSSGTIKGGNLIYKVNNAIKTGGYLLVDELEIHLHKELVLTIIEFFNDPDINKNGATLIFTTHYAEILDSIERKDNIYITRKNNSHNCEMLKYSSVVKRNDIKKSDIFLSNFINGTAPSYESIEKVRMSLCKN
jgi:AAA15 family ATPase/GTPase